MQKKDKLIAKSGTKPGASKFERTILIRELWDTSLASIKTAVLFPLTRIAGRIWRLKNFCCSRLDAIRTALAICSRSESSYSEKDLEGSLRGITSMDGWPLVEYYGM